MNQITFKHDKVNGGKDTSFYTSMDLEETKTQISEIFVEEQYRRGKLKKDMTIIDCGANIGLASLYFKDNAKIIYALEPSSQHYEALVKNVEPYPNIKTFNLGLANYDGWDILSSDGSGRVPISFFGHGAEKETVSVTTIDKFMKDKGIEHIDLLKIDTEGAEYVILPSQGFFDAAAKIDCIVGEAHYIGERLVPEFVPLILADAGFETEFLPIENMLITMSFDAGREKRKYSLCKQTIFFAKRRGLQI